MLARCVTAAALLFCRQRLPRASPRSILTPNPRADPNTMRNAAGAKRPGGKMTTDKRDCPFCAEEMKVTAVVCPHCGRDLRIQDNVQRGRQRLKVLVSDWDRWLSSLDGAASVSPWLRRAITFAHMLDPRGRLARKEYCRYVARGLLIYILCVVMCFIAVAAHILLPLGAQPAGAWDSYMPLALAAIFLLVLVSWPVILITIIALCIAAVLSVKRVHDMGNSGMVRAFRTAGSFCSALAHHTSSWSPRPSPGTKGQNAYGAEP